MGWVSGPGFVTTALEAKERFFLLYRVYWTVLYKRQGNSNNKLFGAEALSFSFFLPSPCDVLQVEVKETWLGKDRMYSLTADQG